MQSNVLKKRISVYPSGLLQTTELQLQVWLWWFQSSDDNASVVGPPGVLPAEVELIQFIGTALHHGLGFLWSLSVTGRSHELLCQPLKKHEESGHAVEGLVSTEVQWRTAGHT